MSVLEEELLPRAAENFDSSRGIAHGWGPEDGLEPLKAHRFEAERA